MMDRLRLILILSLLFLVSFNVHAQSEKYSSVSDCEQFERSWEKSDCYFYFAKEIF